jgi:hypothetical protein
MNSIFLVISCVATLNNCQTPNAPAGLYAGQPMLLDITPRQTCEMQIRKADTSTNANHFTKRPVHSVCAEVSVDTTGGFDAPDADGGASVWVPVFATTDANASAADGPPSGFIPAVVFENNARCLSQLPPVEPGKMYPVCAKVEVYGGAK